VADACKSKCLGGLFTLGFHGSGLLLGGSTFFLLCRRHQKRQQGAESEISKGTRRRTGLADVARPERKVVPKELHDEGRVLFENPLGQLYPLSITVPERADLVALLAEGVKLGNGVVECLLGELARLVRRVEDLVVEDREVERETQSDGMGRGQLNQSDG
jgi:hypothetical protein